MSHTRTTTGVAAAAALVFGITFANAQAPAQRQVPAATPGAQPAMAAHGWKASDLIGASIYTMRDEEKGKIKDLMIGPDGKIAYAAVSFGGFLGIGDKLFAVPMDAIHITWKDGKLEKAKVDVDEQTIKQRQGFDNEHWPQQADRTFVAVSRN
jgi:sporulation protein YlmC with PRC-barrel domain